MCDEGARQIQRHSQMMMLIFQLQRGSMSPSSVASIPLENVSDADEVFEEDEAANVFKHDLKGTTTSHARDNRPRIISRSSSNEHTQASVITSTQVSHRA